MVIIFEKGKEKTEMRLAIIPARGGSKRIPRKNIRDFCGKPILAYSIEAALEAGVFDEVMVSTDDEEIARLAVQFGARVPFMRSERTAGDFATTADVISEVLAKYSRQGREFDVFCCVYPTAPLLTSDRLRTAVQLLEESDMDGVVSVVKYGFPVQRSFVIEEGRLKVKWPEYILARSQDLEPFYHDAGQLYCLRSSRFVQQGKMFMDRTIPLVLSEMEVQDIDTEEDWKIAELKYEMLRHRKA